MSLYSKTKINTPLMHKVLDGDVMKSEMLPHLSVAIRAMFQQTTLAEVIPHVLYKLSAWLPMADYFCVCMMLSPLAVAACPATVCTGGSKRTCSLCRCPLARACSIIALSNFQ